MREVLIYGFLSLSLSLGFVQSSLSADQISASESSGQETAKRGNSAAPNPTSADELNESKTSPENILIPNTETGAEENKTKSSDEDLKNISLLDLMAQQQMADVTKKNLLTSWLQVAISFTAVILVSLTVYYTHKAAKHAESANSAAQEMNKLSDKIAFQQNRPWISFADFQITNLHAFRMEGNPEDTYHLIFTGHYEIHNTGRTPAIHVANGHQIFNSYIPYNDPRIVQFCANVAEATKEQGRAIPPDGNLIEEFNGHLILNAPQNGVKNTIELNITIGACYKSANSNEIFESFQGFNIFQRQEFPPFNATPTSLDYNDIVENNYELIVLRMGVSQMS